MDNPRETMQIVIVGHVDHGKSTIIGRLLADTDSLPEGKLEKIRAKCLRNSRPFEYAFLLDSLKDEQAQGITIDCARIFFSTKKRDYIILDAPGHIEFLRNMVTGSAKAEAALLVIDAEDGVKENSRRHAYLLSLLGIKQVAVLINKMDMVSYSQNVFNKIKNEYFQFLNEIELDVVSIVPVSGREGDMILSSMENMPWYSGENIIDVLDNFNKKVDPIAQPFRMYVQDVYKFTKYGDSRRIIAGSIASGYLNSGDEILFYPSGKRSRVKSLEGFKCDANSKNTPGCAIGITLNEQIFIKRGELVVKTNELKPEVTSLIKVSLFWLGLNSFSFNRDYYLKMGTTKVPFKLESIETVINASDLTKEKERREVFTNEVAECVFKLNKEIAFDLNGFCNEIERFVILDGYEISGGGLIRNALDDGQNELRHNVQRRNLKWVKSNITSLDREKKYNQKSCIILITGERDVGKKPLARSLESSLFSSGRIVYFLGIGNLLYGVDADIKEDIFLHDEHIRRLAEVLNIMLNSGLIIIVTAIKFSPSDFSLFHTVLGDINMISVFLGSDSEESWDLVLNSNDSINKNISKITSILHEKNIIFKC